MSIAYVRPAVMASSGLTFPGLYDLTTEDGQEFRDLTGPQVESMAVRNGWTLRPADQRETGE